MASSKLEFAANVRVDMGKGASRRLRRQEKIPVVVYGAQKPVTLIEVDHKKMVKALEQESFYSRILTLNTDGESEQVILKAIQRHPYKPQIMHMDFQRVRADVKLQMHVPLHFHGGENGPGVKAGGLVSHLVTSVEVSCLPKDLPEYIEVDLSQLELNQVLHLSEITLPDGVELTALAQQNDSAVVSVHMQRVEAEEDLNAAIVAPAEVPAISQKVADSNAEQGKNKDKGK